MTTLIESAIVRVRRTNDTVVGAGFLVTDRHVLTCAHVVTSALGLPHDTPNLPQADLQLDFPLLAPESILTARISHWQPAIDVAVLELSSGPPAESRPVRLVTTNDLWGHSFRALGFPAGYEQGVWASGVLRGRQADGWLQVEDTKETGYLIAPGFSGGPAWDDVLGGVVGMIVAADTDEKIRAAFLIPTNVLEKISPDLARTYAEWAQTQLDSDMDRLRARRDQADKTRREMRERQRVVNLRPLDMTHTFRDRIHEVQAMCDHLSDSSVRLISVVGRGGMGKTALVSRVLGDLERGVLPVPGEEKELPIDGILYLSARSTGLGLERIYADAGRMLGEPIASRLSDRWADEDAPLVAKVEYLLEMMRDGLYLILLDNLEDVLTREGVITEEGLRLFVERCVAMPSGVRLIATSREQAKITAAAFPGTRSISLDEGLPEDEAVILLRNLDPQGTLGLHDAPEENLRHAAQLTQCIPRALEILAGILHEDPTTNLSRLLADERLFGEQVVEQLVAAGYHRLGEADQRVIEALAVFDRPVEETSVAYLLHPWFPGMDVRAKLRRLIKSYFVSVNRVTNEYSLHPLDRDYAYHQIPDSSDEKPDSYNRQNLELRAADFYASIRKPESEWQTIDDLEPQLAEFEHRVRAGNYDKACRMLNTIDRNNLYLWGHYARVVELREKLSEYLTNPSLQAINLGRLGNAYRAMGQIKQAIKLYERAIIIVRETNDRLREGIWLGDLGRAYHELGQFERAIGLSEQALAIFRETNNRQRIGIELGNLGSTYRTLGQVKQAIKFHEEALTIAYETGDRQAKAYHLGDLGSAYRNLGQLEQGIKFHEQALAIFREIGNRWKEGFQLGYLGRAYHELGQIKRAAKLYTEALAIDREINDRLGEAIQVGRLGITHRDLGQVKRAIEHYQQALAINREISDRWGESIWLGHLGLAYYNLGQFEQAIEFYEDGLVIAHELGNRIVESHHLLGLSTVLLATGKLSKARQLCEEALALDVSETSYHAVWVLGIILLHQHNPSAKDAFADAIARCQTVLDKTAGLYEVRYALATALVGQATCAPLWAEETKQAELLAPALAEYHQAMESCPALGVIQDALRDLELIRAAGLEGLEPVFTLLQSGAKE
jgi:tetratricopeptide (TPR) repeat protein